jgi:hypothetical protein
MRWETRWWDIFFDDVLCFRVVVMVVMVIVMVVVVVVVMAVVVIVVAIVMVTVMMTWRWMRITMWRNTYRRCFPWFTVVRVTMRRNTYRRRLIPFLQTLKLALDIFEYIIVKTVVVGMTMWWNTNKRRGMSRGIDNRESGFFECISRGGDIDDRKSRFGFRS